MNRHILLRTNLFICIIIVIGFFITAVLSYRANYSVSLENIEKVSSLTSEGIYYQLTTIFSKPVNVSLTMANDSFLKAYLAEEEEHLKDAGYVDRMKEYLNAYRTKYSYDSVFLISVGTGRYYNFNGVDRTMTEGNPENDWYFAMLDSDEDYSLNVDNDEVDSSNNDITIFVNCKIKDETGAVIGIVGVGVRVDYMQSILREYEEKFGVDALLIDRTGIIEISTSFTGYEKVNMFEKKGLQKIKADVLDWKQAEGSQSMWVDRDGQEEKDYIVTRYIPELSWYLIVERDTGDTIRQFEKQLYQIAAIIVFIIAMILLVITYVIKGYNRQIRKLAEEQAESFRRATEQIYDNIYELNITGNCAAGESTERYFESLGVPRHSKYDQALEIIALKQIREEYRQGYIDMFQTKNVLHEYENGNTHLQYDFMICEDGSDYFWMRIDANIYYCTEDNTVRMFTYRKNIDAEKRQESAIVHLAETDAMTGIYNKTFTQRRAEEILSNAGKDEKYGFFIFDIDNFKQANDTNGHAFGDEVILEFVRILKENFREEDLLGRIGGDEFAALIRIPDKEWTRIKAAELVRRLDVTYTDKQKSFPITVSIGVAVYPEAGTDFTSLYKNADLALYETKRHGKKGYTVFTKKKL